jgi:LysM repeat protein
MFESQILRIFAVAGLAVASVTGMLILLQSGIVGGADNTPTSTERRAGSAEPMPAPADVAAAETVPATEESGESEPPSDEDSGSEESAETSTQPTRTHTVESGDSFYTIAQKYNTTIARIQGLNPNLDPANLKPGVQVVVP